MRGFTLIEIMLVIVIIGCAAGIVVLSIPVAPVQNLAAIYQKKVSNWRPPFKP